MAEYDDYSPPLGGNGNIDDIKVTLYRALVVEDDNLNICFILSTGRR
jgi:hypothetical protein